MTTTQNTTATEWEETDVDGTSAAFKKWEAEKGRSFAKRPPQGRSVWRFLPPIKGTGGNPFFHVWVHFVRERGNRDNIIASGTCPSKMGAGEICVICSEVSRLRRTGVKEDKDYADSLRAENHIYANTVNLEEEDPKVIVMNVPQDVYKTLSGLLKDKEAGGDFTHPERGYNIVITRTGSGRNDTEYDAVPARNASKIMNAGWLGKMNSLPDAAGLIDTALVSAAFAGKALPESAKAPAAALPPASQPAGAPAQDLVEDPITGKWIPRSQLKGA
jgi:hypothetical protein